MQTNRRQFLAGALAASVSRAAMPPLTWNGEQFLWNGKPHVFRSGEMHYPRVPREYWRDRMKKSRSMGLNAICTYVFWNLHETKPGQFDFSGNLDLAEYLRTAHSEGLQVLLRPGPYICSEWEFGGFPAWLLAAPDMKVRSADPKFLAAAERYMKRLGREVAGLQSTRGGPIAMVQVENEYGSFGADHDYMAAIRRMIVDAGFDVPLYTADGSEARMLSGGTLPDTLSVINFGGGNPAREFENFARFRQGVPRMCGEYWVGWFDHWGEQHHTTKPEESARGLEWMLSRGISANLYMFHGGSSWGYMSGANFSRAYEPDISGYDYDSPLDEAGRPTPKFHALRDVIRKYAPAGTEFPELPKPLPMVSIPRFELTESAALTARLPRPQLSDRPITMEAAGQSYGFILYRTRPPKAGKGTLEITEARDYAVILQGTRRLGTLDRRLKQTRLDVELAAGEPLDILVENMGRVNFGPQLTSDRKGITEKVTFDGQELAGWEIYPLPLDDAGKWPFAKKQTAGPALHRGTFRLDLTGDTFFDMRGCGKGIVWVNGHNLGRYWRIGPQQSLFVPAGWLKKGVNEAVVLDLEDRSGRWIEGRTDPVYETPTR
ncbi:MAG TPA: beta-galactosidase family protein [Verrucomicrobiae bacterium]|nr:beta-galactosidase family protein [Verrucomicrobiae bacterium]